MSLEYLSAIRPTQKAMKNSFYYLNKSRFLVKKKQKTQQLNITGEKSFYFQIWSLFLPKLHWKKLQHIW